MLTRRPILSALLAALAIAACVPVAQNGPGAAGGGDGYGGGDPAYAAGGGAGTCEAACGRVAECGVLDMDTCMADCAAAGYSADDLASIAQKDCDTLAGLAAASAGGGGGGGDYGGGGGGRDGTACRQRGVDDCPLMTMCCGGNSSTGTPGQCLSAPVCNMPTR